MTDRAQEMNRLADLATDILYEIGGVVHAMPHRAGSYNEQRTPSCTKSAPMALICEARNHRFSRQVARMSGEG